MARKRNQHGSIRVLSRKSGDVFEYRYYKTRADGERVPANFVVGTVEELNNEAGAWARIRKMGFNPNASSSRITKPVTFGELAKDYIRVELSLDQSEAACYPQSPLNHRNVSSLPESAYLATVGNDPRERHRTD